MTATSHVRHLMLDVLWRGRFAWLWVGAGVLLAWWLAAVGFVGAQAGVAASLIGVFAVGPLTSLTAAVVRETRFLPLTSRDVWVAAWILSTVVATPFVLVVQALGMALGTASGFAQPDATASLLFVGLCAFAYGGTLLPVAPLMGYTSNAAPERRPRWFWASLATLVGLLYFAGLVGPWAAWSLLPTSFATLSWWSGPALFFGLIAAFGAFVWTPQRLGGTSSPGTRFGAGPGTRRGPQNVDRLTGLNRLLLPTLAWAFVMLVTGAIGAALVVIAFEPSQSVYESFAVLGLLPFSAGGLSQKGIVGTALFAPFIVISSSAGWSAYTRHLRVLPLSAADTTRLVTVTTLLLWGVVWAVAIGIHAVVIGEPPATLRPALFIYASGLSALAETVSRTRRKAGRAFPLSVVFVLLAMGFVEGLSGRLGLTGMSWVHAGAGAGAFLVAILLTYRSLTRSTSSAGTYQAVTSFKA